MPATTTLFRAARPAFRANTYASQATRAFRPRFHQQSRRWQSTAADAAVGPSWFKRMWDSPIGLKTWCIVLAGIADFARPAEKLSLTQNAALTATGAIWTRCLATVNFFLGIVGVVQVSRILMYNASVKKQTPEQQLETAKDSVEESAVGVQEAVVDAVKKA
ncbi:hypothetical protein BJ875DRAFT_482616 [Amylocarpus encephaloides]|uniref:Mitochondrial pyruvate carrier n=1 Tax=Amylocarpus encephaloides TaxID=45428 RepID=A0A9P8C6U9_9HELO|nr:hypothetical protein BJ875DRAFT_482616 [Amylocarpus encephaloides]